MKRNTKERVQTWEILAKHASSDDPPIVRLSNRVIRDCLTESGQTVTLPAITARLQSLERHGNIVIRYHVAEYGRVTREIRLLSRPPMPHAPSLESL